MCEHNLMVHTGDKAHPWRCECGYVYGDGTHSSALSEARSMTIEQFQARIGAEIMKPGPRPSQWLVEVGYRKDDKDMGYARWHEITAGKTELIKSPPQKNISFKDEPFALVPETSSDGDRIQNDRDRKARDRAEAESKQLSLLTL